MRWDWKYNKGTGYKKLKTIYGVSVVEIGITDQSSLSSYSDCSLHMNSYHNNGGVFEVRLRLSDDIGIHKLWQGSSGWGYWNNEKGLGRVDAAWFLSLSSESDESIAGFQVMVIRDSTIMFQ